MLKKIINFIYRLFYALPFGLKGANDEIFGNTSVENGVSIQQQINNKSMGEALLQGEVTQEVEELRYKTYKVAKESQNYEYLGDGVAIKKKERNISQVFYIKNHIICESIGHELNRLEKYSIDRYLLNIKYSDIPRFKLEKFCNYIKVNLKTKELTLYFEKNTDKPEVRMFYNELIKTINTTKGEVLDYPQEMKFVTNDTFYEFLFTNKIASSIQEEEHQYVITYSFTDYTIRDIVQENFSESMDKKYKNKEKKDNSLTLVNTERKRFCSVCGKEIDTYDGDITEKSFGYPLCKECLNNLNELSK